jgi:hypothetical protein
LPLSAAGTVGPKVFPLGATSPIALNMRPCGPFDYTPEIQTETLPLQGNVLPSSIVQDPAMLKQVKVGDKVKFDADRVNGQLTVTKIEKSK